ncbi:MULTISPECIES: hypothetical protein [unclassified Mesorhizobium]|uniref:hypothetical protein n=1 Tax=unclassified Mesorhizobium TaxID=325217 RepID=UPI000FC9D933|nr:MULTISPECIES: hypothetical protein [unclassified Mesorhizobium]RUW77270.1 hypothetical protein EOA31_04975 [Mesorhizobium sp. M4B.F.Ca.ET.049.02.1.2]TGV23203.1 hypothetical protein EN786_25255 [Mesorhizobium sp. M4B.F.Ca.ET.143.01.1.1]
MVEINKIDKEELDPDSKKKAARAAINAIAGAIPFVGGLISAGVGYWSENEQEEVTNILRQWLQMLEDELREKGKTIAEIVARLDMNDEKVKERIESPEYQALMKKAFRNWSSIDTEYKRQRIRNILANAAAAKTTSDDVVRLFIDWINLYSDFHFEVIGEIYRNPGITRGGIWDNLSKPEVREDSAEADLFKMLVRDLSTGGVIRQVRQTDYAGNFLRKPPANKSRPGQAPRTAKSAFDEVEPYQLTDLGQQFVHYAMTEIVAKIEFYEFAPGTPA